MRSFGAETMMKTMSAAARSGMPSATPAPASASSSVLDRVRFHTVTSWPASISRLAMAEPMRPVPSHPRVGGGLVMVVSQSVVSDG